MKWISNRYAYPLVILAIFASIGLQAAWLKQLFRVQQAQVRRDLEEVVGNAAKMSNFLSLLPGHKKDENFRDFFLSPEWVQFKQAYTNLRYKHLGSRFHSDIKDDSTIVDISLRIGNGKPSPGAGTNMRWYDAGQTKETIAAADRIDLKRMHALIRKGLDQADLHVTFKEVLYDYESGKSLTPQTKEVIAEADYYSQEYAYNLHFVHTYKLVVTSITNAVIYRMRFYLVSSLTMMILTIAAFYFVFRLLRSQRLYTQARISFTSNMTHELKTPVAIIEVALDAITRYNEPDKLEKYLNISKNELYRLNHMIEKVLNLDQLDNGQVKLKQELYDIQQGMEQVVTAMRLHDPSNASRIIYSPSLEPCFVDGDPVHLTNVFYNLTDNALKYSGKHAQIVITCSCDTHKVTISFHDSGPGIAKIYQTRIFERFFRIHDNTDIHNVKGSGLGLYYVKQIIEKHQGNIHVISEPGKGSTFVIELSSYHEI